MLKIAITGGAGSGKSTVARMFRELGAKVLDADATARQAVAVGRPAWRELRRLLGPECFLPDGELNRARVARLVFADPQTRQRLNDIVHPRVARELKKRFQELERQGAGLVLVEVDSEDQVRRLQERDGRGALEIRGMLQAQDPLAEKAARADDVVDNRGSLNDTRSQVAAIWRELQHLLDQKREKAASP